MTKKDNWPIGAHVSIKDGYTGAFKEALDLGASALQLFAKSPMQAKFREVSALESKEVSTLPNRGKISYAVIHSSYLLNFAKKLSPDAYEQKSILEDLRSADKLGAEGVVLHMGKATIGKEVGTKLFIENVTNILIKSSGQKAKLILENTAGQGTELGFRFDEYGAIYKAIKKAAGKEAKRLAMCLDTAHAFGGGYDLRDTTTVKTTLADLEKNIGLDEITCVHFNDSKKPLESRVDRHQDIGYGTIGNEGLCAFVKQLAKASGRLIPLILETPQEHTSYSKQISKLNEWIDS